MRARGGVGGDEDGSVLPLVLGYVVLALATVLVSVNATSLYLAQKHLDQVADAAALAGADGFVLDLVDESPRALLTEPAVRAQADAVVAGAGDGVWLEEATAVDGVSARVRVGASWHPVLVSWLVPEGVALTSVATSRNAVR